MVAIAAGLAAGSAALTGFGIDSVIEVTSGALLWWRLRAELGSAPLGPTVQRRASRAAPTSPPALPPGPLEAVGELQAPDTLVRKLGDQQRERFGVPRDA